MTSEVAVVERGTVQEVMKPSEVSPTLLPAEPPSHPWQEYDCFIGVSTNIRELKEFIALHGSSRRPVLLIGERGLRQEQIARTLHAAGAERAQPFFSLNVHNLNPDSLSQLIFNPRGLVDACGQGTIYLNEVARLPRLLQQRLALFLEEQSGSERSGPRFVFATARKLHEIKSDSSSLQHLLELLRPATFYLKPLRQRSEDLPYLIHHLAGRVARRLNKGMHQITAEALQALTEYSWEANIDEVEAVLESAIAATPPAQIKKNELPAHIRNATLDTIPPGGINLWQRVNDFEQTLIDTALRQTHGSQTKAAQLLGLKLQTLNMKLKRFVEQQREEA